MKLSKVVELIRGKRGSKVRLTVIPAGAAESAPPVEIILKRDEIKLTEQYAKARIYEHRTADGQVKRVGVITLPQFYQHTVADVTRLLERLKTENISGLILDLRRNGGGLLDQAIDLTGLFIKPGPVVQVKDASGRIQILRTSSRRPIYDGPVICMGGHMSASASEIVAGALQDYGRALIVGDKSTHGKGTVQVLEPLDRWMGFGWTGGDPGKIKITVSKFYRVAGGSTQQKGVIPDISLPSALDYYEIGERFLPNCLPYDEVPAVSYDPMNMVTSYLPELIAASNQRVGKSREFAYVREDIEYLKKKLQDKSVSLNQAERLKEKNDLQALADARKAERAKRNAESQDKVYELTLEMVDKNTPLAEAKPAKISPTSTDAANTSADGETNPADEPESGADPQLMETVNIMCDYAAMLRGNGSVAANAN
jgi:carboxyl-terminal processing protease